jgi:CRISPR system Cascade subunit CasE
MTAPADTGLALCMLRLLPDMAALGRWVAATGQRALREDVGYALHAALRATLGHHAPRPFALLQRPGSLQLIGYSTQAAATLMQALESACVTDPLAAQALGQLPTQEPLVKAMPQRWTTGQALSFECRVAPVVRSRVAAGQGAAAMAGGRYPEVDAAFHASFHQGQPGDREAAHGRWLARELARDGAATLRSHRAAAFQLTPIARRSHRADTRPQSTARATQTGLLPDLTVRGQLQVDDPIAFQRLLARGLGRHRSFGFGCLLLAPPGAWT